MIPSSFFEQLDVVAVAERLIGKRLLSRKGGQVTGGIITETEAYRAPEDKASHAYGMRRTRRTETLFGPPATAYIYLCYGIHSLLNIVTGPIGTPHAVLIRALEPTEGVEVMEGRRGGKRPLAGGPGTLCQALGLTTRDDGTPLGKRLWIEEGPPLAQTIQSGPRIGIDYAEEWASQPWRFYL
ncbi:MAG: DNA-3-methyladenine glycosylase [Parachlamydiales bacterium]